MIAFIFKISFNALSKINFSESEREGCEGV